ncbi:uncharacterized protein LOC122635817 isoform X3 [Vespula pensylvanica]|uniref:uncharacterized protein LOC122635817 isoform X3 n=1 Tax=Vespula pensylvanica TaxID=30213 RepID=UPI001CB9F1F6|nr:uncharacterized protein LOC122635817 isoform X3 [Vespula pensylvanica]
MQKMTLIVPLKVLSILFLFLPKIASLSEFHTVGVEQTPFIIDICKFYGPKSIIFLYTKSIKEMKITTTIFKWRRALSREGVASTNLYFSQLQESSYYLKQSIRPYYIALISNPTAINEFSLATSTFDMSSAVWLAIFISKENDTDYCHNPPATWSLEGGITKIVPDFLYKRRCNLRGLIMRAVVVKGSQFVIKKRMAK